MIDSRKITDLHPCLQRGAKELIRRMAAYGYPMGISSTYRDNESQNALYAQGRTKPGSIVTNAKGGQSIHNYRLAFDIFLNIRGQEYSNSAFFDLAGKIWTEMGGEWGGNWKSFVDRPHMQFTGGLSLSDLQRGESLSDYAKMIWESDFEETEEENNMQVFNKIEELPEYARQPIKALMDGKFLFGDEDGNLNIFEYELKSLVVLGRVVGKM